MMNSVLWDEELGETNVRKEQERRKRRDPTSFQYYSVLKICFFNFRSKIGKKILESGISNPEELAIDR
jgi:hypothetical protein